MTVAEKVRENKARRWADRLGYSIRKSKAKRVHHNDQGQYMLVEDAHNQGILGWDYDASLDEIEAYLEKVEAKLTAQRR